MNRETLLIIARDSQLVMGALGSLEKCNGYVEKFYLDGEQGYLTKYFGVKTPYKGWIDTDRIDRVTITKKAFRELIRAMWFRPKALFNSFLTLYRAEGGLRDYRLNDYEFCPAVRELIRVGKKVNEDLAYCAGMFIYFSPTYRVWLQDIIGELDKENFDKNPLTEILRLKRIFMGRLERYQSGNPERKMVNMLWWLLIGAITLKRKQAKEIVRDLDISKVKLDALDRYYCLRRDSYNIWGLSLEDRLKLVGEIDEMEGNIILNI